VWTLGALEGYSGECENGEVQECPSSQDVGEKKCGEEEVKEQEQEGERTTEWRGEETRRWCRWEGL